MSRGHAHALWRGGGRHRRRPPSQWSMDMESHCCPFFTTPTHRPQSERRCLDTNSPRSDPECMWLLCPGYRWTIWASWSRARCCGCSGGTRAWSGWRSWYLTRRRAARGAWNASRPLAGRRRAPPGTDRRAAAPRWARAPWGLAASRTGWSPSGRISGSWPLWATSRSIVSTKEEHSGWWSQSLADGAGVQATDGL